MKYTPLHSFIFIFFALLFIEGYSQTATIVGVTLDEFNTPIADANVRSKSDGVKSDKNGVYTLEIPANTDVKISISHIAQKTVTFTINLKPDQVYEFNPVLNTNIEQISTVVISGNERKAVQGITTLNPETIRTTPSANAGVEGLLKTLPGVSSNNELSSQYSVRGGNFDENLVYVNEIEVYRPFLIRSGQQEGLSFVNSSMVKNVDFSAGGFQAKFGDKLSSVLDITYRKPTSFGGRAELSFLGADIALEGASKNKKLKAIGGVRYRDNSLFVKGKQTQTNFNPRFIDGQSYISYDFNKKLAIGLLTNASLNKYEYQPLFRQTNFGTAVVPKTLIIRYSGQEIDQYETYFGALKGTYKWNDNLTLKLIGSGFHTQEQEYFDIIANYSLGEPNTNIGDEDLGKVASEKGAGSQLTHARNDLDALIFNLEHKGSYRKNEHTIDWGLKYTNEDIKDRVEEYEILDFSGFSQEPPIPPFVNQEPETPDTREITPFTSVRAFNSVKIQRYSGFLQYSKKTGLGAHEIWYNIGIRNHNWTISGDGINALSQHIFTPRAQFTIKPSWKKDMLFRVSGGFYYQPPFYREYRDASGTVQPKVRSQKSLHAVIGNDFNFKWKERPFKLTSEAYYKRINDVNPYTIENVRIRYAARNNAIARAYGFDFRLNGEFVPGTESWISLGYLKTEENINDRGWIDRPSDQRLKVAVLFQDYVPRIPSLRMYLNLVYSSGVPGGSPSFEDPYSPSGVRVRLPNYGRADLGINYVLVDAKKQFTKGHVFHFFKELTVGFEIFNIFDNQNSITNTFVRDAESLNQFAIPNFLTPRLFNLRIRSKF